MKKKLFILALIIILICFLIIEILGYTPMSLYARMYAGNHIAVNIHATIDGEDVYTDKHSIEVSEEEKYDYANNISKISKKKDFSVLKCKASSYGAYDFYLIIDDTYPVTINMYQWNWWDIQRSDLYIDIDSKSNTITYYDNYTSLNEQGAKCKNQNKKQRTSFNDSPIQIWVGAR